MARQTNVPACTWRAACRSDENHPPELLEAEFKVRNAPREVDWTHGLMRCSFHPQRSVWADWW